MHVLVICHKTVYLTSQLPHTVDKLKKDWCPLIVTRILVTMTNALYSTIIGPITKSSHMLVLIKNKDHVLYIFVLLFMNYF